MTVISLGGGKPSPSRTRGRSLGHTRVASVAQKGLLGGGAGAGLPGQTEALGVGSVAQLGLRALSSQVRQSRGPRSRPKSGCLSS